MYFPHLLKITFLTLTLALAACDDYAISRVSHTDNTLQPLNDGYGILYTTLKDEQHLKTIRLTKAIVSFESISESTRHIIDDIAQLSSESVGELAHLATFSPEIIFNAEKGGQIEQITHRALRFTTAKEFLTSKDNFEVVLIVSQIQALRLISHLAKELQDIDTNNDRKVWLDSISDQYEKLYFRVLSRLTVS